MSESPPSEYQTVVDLVVDKAVTKEDDPLVHCGERSYSYREVNARADAVATELAGRGVRNGSKVCTFLSNSPEHLVAWFGIAKTGAIMVPLNTDLRGDELTYILDDCEASTILLEEGTRENYETVRDDIDTIQREYLLSDETRGGYTPFEDLVSSDSAESLSPDLGRSDPMSIIYTSGTTGRPKGVLLPHFSYINTGWEYGHNTFQLDETDRPFTTLPLSHCNAQQTTVMGSMLAETDFVLQRTFDPTTFWDEIRRHDATIFNYIGTMITNLYKQDEREDDSRNPAVYGVGADAATELIEDFETRFDVRLIEGYGLTETSTVATINPVDDRRIGSIGKPLSYTEVEIVDGEDQPLPPGEEGEIVVRSTRPNTFMLEYYNKHAETVDAWQNLWFHTGDIGYKDEEGYLFFVDRKAYAIQQRGGNISSFEVENVLSDHPDVQEVAVFGVPNTRGEEEVKAVIVPTPDSDVTPVDVAEYCDGHLPYFKVPRYIEITSDVPKTATERIQKYELKSRGVAGAWDRETGYELQR